MTRDTRVFLRGGSSEAGNTLVVVLLVLFLLTSLGISYIAVTKGEKQIAGNQAVGTQAFQNAEAGISEALERMSIPSSPDYIGETPSNWHPGWGKYIVTDPGNSGLDPNYNATTSDGMDNDLDAAIDESSEHYLETGSKQNIMALANKLDYPWVKVRYKTNAAHQILMFGDDDNNLLTPPKENLVRGYPEIIVTAAGRRNLGNKIVTVEAVKWPVAPIPGSVYTEDAMSFAGNSFYIDGHDHDWQAPYDTIPGAQSLPGIATPNDPNAISSQLAGNQYDNVQGTGADPSVRSSPVNLDLVSMANSWDQIADLNYSGNQVDPDMSGWGTAPDNLKVIHCAGNLQINGNNTGAGVLIVDGDFTMGGTLNWNGVIICLGNVIIQGGGNAKNIVGSLLVQGTLGGTTTVNGNVKIMYSSAMLQQLYSLTRYQVSSWIDQ